MGWFLVPPVPACPTHDDPRARHFRPATMTRPATTVRASTPMYLLSRKIKAMGVKMVLSGEGSDEIFGGYLYFHAAPNKAEFQKETVRRVKNLHLADCLRANKSTSAWGLEARVPFLDKQFLEVCIQFNRYLYTMLANALICCTAFSHVTTL